MDGQTRTRMAVSLDTRAKTTLAQIFDFESAFYVAGDAAVAWIEEIQLKPGENKVLVFIIAEA